MESVEACEQLFIHAYTHSSNNPTGTHLFLFQMGPRSKGVKSFGVPAVWGGTMDGWNRAWKKVQRPAAMAGRKCGACSHWLSCLTGAPLYNLWHVSRHCTPSTALFSGAPLSSTDSLRIPRKGYLTWDFSKTTDLLSSSLDLSLPRHACLRPALSGHIINHLASSGLCGQTIWDLSFHFLFFSP